jgi:uncharacterized membrane protein YeiH
LNLPALAYLYTGLDLLGTFVFATSGAISGVRHRVDLFGVLVLSFVAATSGGILRDVLMGATPPAAINDWRYLAVSALAGVVTFYRCATIANLRGTLLIFDAAGLGLYCVAGTTKALSAGLSPLAAVLLGMLTGIGGGIVRDVLVGEVPAVFRAETKLYAVAAIAADHVGRSVALFRPSLCGDPPRLGVARRGGARLKFHLRFVDRCRRVRDAATLESETHCDVIRFSVEAQLGVGRDFGISDGFEVETKPHKFRAQLLGIQTGRYRSAPNS